MKRLLTFALFAFSFAVFAPAAMATRQIATVTVGAQVTNPLTPGGSSTFTITTTWAGSSGTCTSNPVTINWTAPTGATTSFTPTTVTSSSTTTVLEIDTTGATPAATTPFTVTVSNPASGCTAANSVTSASANFVVGPNPAVGTTGTVTSSVNPSIPGQSVTFTATIVPASGTTVPTGTVQFQIDAANFGAAVTVAGCAPSPNACATSGATTSLTAGGHTVTATFTPNANTGAVTFTVAAGPNQNDSIVVGAVTYTWRNAQPPTSVNQIFDTTTNALAAQNFQAAIMGNSALCGDTNCINAGQTANANAVATTNGTVVTVTNKSGANDAFSVTFNSATTYTIAPASGGIPSGFVSSTGTLSGGQQVVNVPTIAKSFAPTSISVGSASTLSIIITNTNASIMSGVGVADNLPTNMKVFTTPGASNTCGGTWAPVANATSVTLSGGSIPASSSCTVTVAITTSASGPFTNTTNAVTSTNDGTGGTATANLTAVGVASKLAFTTSPSNSTAGSAFGTQPVVALEDASGNIVTGTAQNVTLTIQSNPGSGTLSGTTTVAVNTATGLATFSGLSINKSGTGYTLTAAGSTVNTSPGTIISGSFNITAGTATQLVYTTPPSTPDNGGTAFGTQPVVSIEDSLGNVVTTATNAITLAIGTNPVGGALTCTSSNPLPAIAGVATFVGCSINKASAGYTLTASASGLSTATSGSITIQVGPATKIVFGVSPSNTVAGSPINPAVTVLIEDAGGNVTTSTASVGMAIGTNPGTSTLSGTTPQTAVNGTATFADLSLNKVGTAYTLVASSSGFTNVTSATFNITVGTATQLAFTQQPGGGSGGTAWVTVSQPKVSVEDANGNVVTAGTNNNASITLAIGTNAGPGGTLTCTTNPQSATAGVDTFAGCKIDVAGTAYTLTAAASGLTGATSNPFNITVGTANKLAFTVSPASSTGGVAFPTQPVVTLEDAGGNAVTGTAQTVTLSIQTNAGPGGTLSGTTAVAVNTGTGLATFSGLSINTAGNGYTLTAKGSTVDTTAGTIISGAFNITVGTPTQLTFSTEPASTNNHVTMPNVVVQIQDAGGNLVPTASAAVTLAIGTNPSSGTLSGTLTQNTSGGAATFNDLSIDNVGTNYTLTATSSPVFTPETSTQFNITAGPASQLVFTTQPSAVSAPGTVFAVQPVVSVEDSHGNVITSGTGSNASITLAIGFNAGPGGVLSCTTDPVTATAGVSTFAGCKINLVGNNYTLTAAASGFTTVTSSPITITLGTTKQISEQIAASCSSTAITCTIALDASALTSSNNMLLVGVSMGHNSATTRTVTGITWNGTPLTLVPSCSNTASSSAGANSARIEIWSLANPSLVSGSAVVTLNGAAQHTYAGAVIFSNVASVGSCLTSQSSGGTGTSASLSVTVPAGGISFDTLAVNTISSVTIAAPPAAQATLWNISAGSSGGAASYATAPISTMSRSWNQNTSINAYGALSLNPTMSHKTGGKVIIGSLLEQEKPNPSIFHLGDSMRSTNSTDAASPLANADQPNDASNSAIISKRDE